MRLVESVYNATLPLPVPLSEFRALHISENRLFRRQSATQGFLDHPVLGRASLRLNASEG